MPFSKYTNKLIYLFSFLTFAILCFYILNHANWSLGDQLQFLKTTATGKVLPITNYIIPDLGRFFPLGLMDYNLLLVLPFGVSAFSHFLLNAISFIIFSATFYSITLRINNSFNYNKTIGLLITFLFTLFVVQRVYIVFLDLIFPERLMACLLSLFILSNISLAKKTKPYLIILSTLIAIYLTYSKEPVFGALFIFATIGLIAHWNIANKWFKSYYVLLILNSIIFIAIYYYFIYRNVTQMYDGSHGENNMLKNIFQMVWSHKIILPALILLPLRAYSFFIKRNYNNYIYDALLFSGIAYFGACLLLNLNFTYYYLPSVVLITPAVVYFSLYYVKQRITLILALSFGIFYAIKLPENITTSQNQRKSTYPQIEVLANFSNQGYEIIWINSTSTNNWDLTLDEWRRESYESYIAYILKNDKFKIKKSDPIESLKEKKIIYLFNKNEFENLKTSFYTPNKINVESISQSSDVCILKSTLND